MTARSKHAYSWLYGSSAAKSVKNGPRANILSVRTRVSLLIRDLLRERKRWEPRSRTGKTSQTSNARFSFRANKGVYLCLMLHLTKGENELVEKERNIILCESNLFEKVTKENIYIFKNDRAKLFGTLPGPILISRTDSGAKGLVDFSYWPSEVN